jgi:antitoxin component of MazEF toxin-antitoxin module
MTITWGNDDLTMRIPRDVLSAAGLSSGDIVDVQVNERGTIELVPRASCRVGTRRRRVTFDELFRDYRGAGESLADPWGSDELVGAEKDAWS